MFKEAADIKTSDQLHLPVPEAKFETVVVKTSEIQQDIDVYKRQVRDSVKVQHLQVPSAHPHC